jgi:hypothetical protein
VEWLYSGGDEHELVEHGDLLRPGPGVRMGVLPQGRRDGLVRQVVLGEVDGLELGVSSLTRHLVDPLSDRLTVAPWADAPGENSDLQRRSKLDEPR